MEIQIQRHGKTVLARAIDGTTVIGRAHDADIRLDDGSCSRKHLKIYRHNEAWFASDMNSSNGTLYNDHRLSEAVTLHDGDTLHIGEHDIVVKFSRPEEYEHTPEMPVRDPGDTPEPAHEPAAQYSSQTCMPMEKIDALKQEIHRLLLEEMDLKHIDLSRLQTEEIRRKATIAVKGIMVRLREKGASGPALDESFLLKDVIDEALGLGPIEQFLDDRSVSEIMVNAKDQIYIEKKGRLEKTDLRFSSDQAVLNVIERIVSPIGRRIDEGSPTVDARLKDGSRVHVIIPPLALKGPTLTIRKFSRIPYTMDDIIAFGSLTDNMAGFLKIAIQARKNIIISGGTGSGKTTLLNVLSGFIREDERILTIEDAAELKLSQPHVVSLEARPPNIEGRGAITIRDLVRNALRMRPDRIVVGECRGGEALDMLQAMNTGHDGSLTTLHANSPRDVLSRLETMVLMSGMELPVKAIREQITSAVDIIVQQTRFKDGVRRISAISEVQGMEGDTIVLQDIFSYETTGMDASGKITGRFTSTGFVPRFIEELRAQHVDVPQEIFR